VRSAKKKRAATKNAKKGAKARWKNHPQDIKKMMKKHHCSRQWASVLVGRERDKEAARGEQHENPGSRS
jgi:virulence-associated protein VapD